MSTQFAECSTSDYGNFLGGAQFMDISIRQLWDIGYRISGPAFTVQLAPGDNLMLHKAIYEAPEGSIMVVDGVDTASAVAGGNVCAVAQKRGIVGFIIDGVIRDIEEIKNIKFPVYAKGLFPVPGKKQIYTELCQPICCGGVTVHTGDIIVADADGIAVLPQGEAIGIYEKAREKASLESKMTLEAWEKKHHAMVEQAITKAMDTQRSN